MKRSPRFLIVIASAILTFGILFATVGKPKYFDYHCSNKSECHNINVQNVK